MLVHCCFIYIKKLNICFMVDSKQSVQTLEDHFRGTLHHYHPRHHENGCLLEIQLSEITCDW